MSKLQQMLVVQIQLLKYAKRLVSGKYKFPAYHLQVHHFLVTSQFFWLPLLHLTFQPTLDLV